MKKTTAFIIALFFIQCSSIRVFSDYDNEVDFSTYTSFAFFKPGIEEVEISELDKRRILNSITAEMEGKKMVLSDTPDLLINIAVKASNRVVVNNNMSMMGWGWGWGWGWNPWMMGGPNSITTQTRGELFIDLIDAKTKRLVWQGKGHGGISEYSKNRAEKIQTFVTEILTNYPPVKEENN